MAKKPRTNVTHHRSNHLAGDGGYCPAASLRTQLSLIVPKESLGAWAGAG